MKFDDLRLIEPLLRAIRSEGYTIPTAIQELAIPHLLEGKDLMGCAQTGTGKTAAFALPILQRLHAQSAAAHNQPVPGEPKSAPRPHGQGKAAGANHRPIRALIMTPTRELAAQIGESFRAYGQYTRLKHTVIFGGVKQGAQTQALHQGVDILVATPGRLLDLLQQKQLTLQYLQVLVLDEADRMLDMGFIHDIRRIIAQVPARRQTLMFSATMPKEIRSLANTLLQTPVEVKVASQSLAADTVDQALYHIDTQNKPILLEQLLQQDDQITRALIFTRTKHGADKVCKRLEYAGVRAEAIHANKSQNARIRALDNFKRGLTRVLVASDIASRGLDVDDISHVINYDLPNEPETYVHRIGRTGRAGASGQAVSFCCEEQRGLLRDIERLLGREIPVLKHAIKPAPPLPRLPARTPSRPQSRFSSAKQGGQGQSQGQGDSQGQGQGQASQGARKTGSGQQQKNEFWRRTRKSGGASSVGRSRRRPNAG